jgi:hypothetical protein
MFGEGKEDAVPFRIALEVSPWLFRSYSYFQKNIGPSFI